MRKIGLKMGSIFFEKKVFNITPMVDFRRIHRDIKNRAKKFSTLRNSLFCILGICTYQKFFVPLQLAFGTKIAKGR